MAEWAAVRKTTPEPQPGMAAVRWSANALLVTTWISAAIFGVYILAFYGGAAPRGALADWNHTIPRLYEPATPSATIAMGAHFLTGALLVVLGPVQLLGRVRARFPAVHRWIGRAYVLSAGIAGVAGLTFIAIKGTVGGPIMSAGFALYGALVTVAAAQAYRYGRARRFDLHRAWAIRLFSLVIGAWLFRMEYGFWIAATDGVGSTRAFTGPFDHVMAFFFYLPNLAVAELFIRSTRRANFAVRLGSAVTMAFATALTLVGSYFFVTGYWGPGILAAF